MYIYIDWLRQDCGNLIFIEGSSSHREFTFNPSISQDGNLSAQVKLFINPAKMHKK